jgi:rod shape-determining protein MreD
LCVYLGVYHPTVGAALGSFALGYSVDVLSSPLLGMNAFAMSSVFLAVYLGARTIWLELHNLLLSALVVLAASLVKSAALILIWALFLSVDGLWSGAIRYVITEALLAAALAPLFFLILQRGQSLLQATSATRE